MVSIFTPNMSNWFLTELGDLIAKNTAFQVCAPIFLILFGLIYSLQLKTEIGKPTLRAYSRLVQTVVTCNILLLFVSIGPTASDGHFWLLILFYFL